MNNVDFQEKMVPTHRASFCRMLNVKDLPKQLLEQYVQVKRLVDRIDGSLSPGVLAMIILGANLQTQADELAKEPPALDESGDKVIEEAVEPPAQPVEQPVDPQPVVPPTDEQIEQQAKKTAEKAVLDAAIEPPVSGVTGQTAEKSDKGEAKFWAPQMPVNVLQNEELKKGKIFAVHPPEDSTEKVQLTVEFPDGTTVMVNEDECEAI